MQWGDSEILTFPIPFPVQWGDSDNLTFPIPFPVQLGYSDNLTFTIDFSVQWEDSDNLTFPIDSPVQGEDEMISSIVKTFPPCSGPLMEDGDTLCKTPHLRHFSPAATRSRSLLWRQPHPFCTEYSGATGNTRNNSTFPVAGMLVSGILGTPSPFLQRVFWCNRED